MQTMYADTPITTSPKPQSKLQSLRRKMTAHRLDSLLLTFLPDIRWLTGFSGSNAQLVITPDDAILYTDFRYKEQVKTEVQHAESVITSEGYVHELKSGEVALGARLGIQGDKLAFATVEKLKTDLAAVELVSLSQVCDEYVAVKTDEELSRMKRAVAITDKVFNKILDMISPRVTEREIAAEISYWNKRFGAEKDSFDPIVASGARGAFPHARATDNLVENNSLLVIDMGCMVEGYCSDQTRTVAVGKISDEARRAYHLVLDAHLLGINHARAGMVAKDLDAIARDYLAANGYTEEFGHSLGHAVGLQVHEFPVISKRTEALIPNGAVITIEPGVYVTGKFGIRIEDMVHVTERGATPLPTAPKHLIEL
jgi:Xaa-Pro aminopeptidase